MTLGEAAKGWRGVEGCVCGGGGGEAGGVVKGICQSRDHEEVLVQSTVVDDNVFLGTIEDNQVSGDWLHQSQTLIVVVKQPHTVNLNEGVSCLLTVHQLWMRVLTTVPGNLRLGGSDVHAEVVEPELPVPDVPSVAMRTGFRSLDAVQLEDVFVQRASVMHVPVFLKGPFRNALRVALSEILEGSAAGDELRDERGGSCFSCSHGCC